MSFLKGIIGHPFRDIFSQSLFLPSKNVYREARESTAQTLRALKLDLEMYEEQIKREFDPQIKASLNQKIAETKQEIVSLESVEMAPGSLLLNGLRNSIDEIGILMDREPDIKKREKLKQQQLNCLNVLTERQKPMNNPDELDDALDVIESDERILQSLQKKTFDQVDLELILKSDMVAFFDTRDRQALETAFEQMLANDNAKSVLQRNEHQFVDAELEWDQHKAEVENSIQDYKAEEAELVSKISEAKDPEKESLRNRLKEVRSDIRHLQAEIQGGYTEWTHRQRTLQEKESSGSVLSMVKPDTLNLLSSRIKEAQMIRMEKVQDFMAGRLADLEKKLANHRNIGTFSPETQKSIENKLAEARQLIVEEKQYDPKTIRTLARNFEAARIALEGEDGKGGSVGEINYVKENRPKIEAQIQTDFKNFKSVIHSLTPARIREIEERYKTQLAGEESAIARKALNALHALADPNSDLHTHLDELGDRLENISEIRHEELLAVQQDLNHIGRKLEFLQTEEAEKAHRTIEAIQGAQTALEVQKILDENLGVERLQNHRDTENKRINGDPSKKVKIIPSNEFESGYRDHTKRGKMVFYEKGDEWYILIDQSAFESEAELANLKKQITHELLHLEFEKSPRVQKDARKVMIEDNPEKWKEIRAAFLALNKKPPHGDEWDDNDILSELFAMQNEIGQGFTTGHSAKDHLNNLLTGIGAAKGLGNIKTKTKAYKNDAEEEIHAYEEGMENATGDDSSSAAGIETMSKEEAIYKGNKDDIEGLQTRMDELRQSEHLGMVDGAPELIDAMERFNKGTAELNDRLAGNPSSEVLASAVKTRVSRVSGDLTDIEDKVGKAARTAPNTEISIFRKLWLNTTFLSMQDFVQAGTDVYEFIKRRHDRKVADHAAKIGMALFSGTDLGREARARQQKAEMEEVNEWQSRYENMDAWQLLDELDGIGDSLTPNQDQLKAIMRILAKKGRIDWQNESLWKALNKLQSTVVLKPGDKLLLHNPVLLRQRLHRAFGEVYDYDEFPSLERDNESAYKSEKGKYDTLHSRMQDKLTDRLDELLAQKRDGEQVEPMLYESILEYSIKNGKSYAENVMFHLMAGMAEGILAPDRGLALGDYLNEWPAVDWFSTMSPPMSRQDWMDYCKKNFGHSFNRGSITAPGYGADFKNWYWTVVQNSGKVVERVKKSVSERKWDHDWGRSIACLGDANTAKRFLSGRSGQEETKSTAVGNSIVGAVQWLEENAKNPKAANRANFAKIAGWIAMTKGMLDGTAYKESSKDINTRANEAMLQDIPREAVVGNHPGVNMKQHLNMTENYLMLIDPGFFSILSGREARSKEQKAELGAAARNYLVQRYPGLAPQLADVEDIDQIYDRLDLIIGTMFSQMSEAQFQSILRTLAAK